MRVGGCRGVLLIVIPFDLQNKQAPVDNIGLHVIYKFLLLFPGGCLGLGFFTSCTYCTQSEAAVLSVMVVRVRCSQG